MLADGFNQDTVYTFGCIVADMKSIHGVRLLIKHFAASLPEYPDDIPF